MAVIDGKVVAITGASSGIGAATARRLAASGARVCSAREESNAWLRSQTRSPVLVDRSFTPLPMSGDVKTW